MASELVEYMSNILAIVTTKKTEESQLMIGLITYSIYRDRFLKTTRFSPKW